MPTHATRTTTPGPAVELADLIAEQARDDATDRLPRDRRVIREADLDAGRDPETGRRRRANLATFGEAARDRDRPASKWRGRARKVAVRDDLGKWRDTEAAGRHVGFWVLLVGVHPWERSIHDAVADDACACPVCSGRVRSRGHYCTYCDRCGLDDLVAAGKLELWGLRPDTVLNPIAEDYDRERREEQRRAKERRHRERTVRGGLGR